MITLKDKERTLQRWSPHSPSRPWSDPRRCWPGGWHAAAAPVPRSPPASSQLARHPGTPGTPLGGGRATRGEETKSSFNQSNLSQCSRLSRRKVPPRPAEKKAPHLLPVPSWAVLLLSRSVMISAWMSLILLRSAARLYSICSVCVWGITCFSCTWTRTHREDAAVAEKKKTPLIKFCLFSPTFPASVRLATKVAKAWQTLHCLSVYRSSQFTRMPTWNEQQAVRSLVLSPQSKVHYMGIRKKDQIRNSTNLHAGRESPVDLCYDVDNFSHPALATQHKHTGCSL